LARGWRTRIALGAFLGVVLVVYALNASWLARPTGELQILAHRGPHQRFHREGVTDTTCTAAQSLPPTHGYLENTLPSIKAAFDLGADIVELDIHTTTDGEFAGFHDWTVDCRTEGKGVTRELPMTYLRTLDLGYGYTADGGRTFPLRGTGVGMMPTFAEVIAAHPGRRFLVNIKSNDAEEGKRLDAYMTAHGIDRGKLWFYGGAKATAQIKGVDAGVTDRSKDCMIRYVALGWSGHVPAACKGALVAVPINFRRLFWGWPNRFLVRMEKAGANVFVGGEADLSRMSLHGLDEPAQLKTLPKGWRGGVMTDAIEVVGPALKPGIAPFQPNLPQAPPPSR